MNEPTHPSASETEQPPPVLGSWRLVYLVVLCNLALLVMLFYVLGRWAQ